MEPSGSGQRLTRGVACAACPESFSDAFPDPTAASEPVFGAGLQTAPLLPPPRTVATLSSTHVKTKWHRRQSRMTTLDGQVALVTGASRGVGRGVALGLAHAGVKVFATGRSVTHAELGSDITAIACDHTEDPVVSRVYSLWRMCSRSGCANLYLGCSEPDSSSFEKPGAWPSRAYR